MRFIDKTVVVTGGGKGIGKAISTAFVKEGANIMIGDFENKTGNDTRIELQSFGTKVEFVEMDVRKKSDCEKLIETAVNIFGGIDIAVNNAGLSSMYWAVDLPEDEWDNIMNTNAKGVFLCSQAEVKQFIEQKKGGKIVNLASIAGKRAAYFLSHYVASKFAVIGFSKSLALEVAKYNINVNCVCPGLVQTDIQKREIKWEADLRGITEEKIKAEYLEMTPLGRLEEPDDVARLILFLCSDDASFITGEAVDVTGGLGLTC
jgi:NAD(P)-dependent dehydrogenase (short-subunit alcohol dehydrogenase family)